MGLFGRAESSINVAIKGDPQDLQRALRESDRAIGGLSSTAVKAGGIIAGAFATDALLDFGATALGEADRVGDALGRLEGQIGSDLTAAIDAASEGLVHLGQSRQDVLELSAAFADIATAAGVADPEIAAMAAEAAALAAALELSGVGDAATNIQNIGKAADGGERAMRALGVNLTDAEVEARALADTGKLTADALTDGERAAAGYALVLEDLRERLGDTTQGSQDLEQSQRELEARWETLTGKIGGALEGPLNGLLAWILAGIDGWGLFADRVGEVGDAITAVGGPIEAARKILEDLIDTLERVFANQPGRGAFDLGDLPSSGPGVGGGGFGGWVPQSGTVNVNIQGGNPADVEDAVHQAITGFSGKNGFLYPD